MRREELARASAAWLAGLLAGLFVLGGPAEAAPQRIYIASDSTAAEYRPDQYPQMGWGMFLRCSLRPGVEVINLARGGRSTKTYVEEGLWEDLLGRLRPGDTVLIQFGHNDEDLAKPVRHTEPEVYEANLRRFVGDVRTRRAAPVVVTPLARHAFKAGRIQETHGAYVEAARHVASATRAPLLDLDRRSQAFLQAVGEEGARRYFMIYPPGAVSRLPKGLEDTTHLNERGARAMAVLVAQGLKSLPTPVAGRVAPTRPGSVEALGDPRCQ
jgi:lysophospholipase L1-like esterase